MDAQTTQQSGSKSDKNGKAHLADAASPLHTWSTFFRGEMLKLVEEQQAQADKALHEWSKSVHEANRMFEASVRNAQDMSAKSFAALRGLLG